MHVGDVSRRIMLMSVEALRAVTVGASPPPEQTNNTFLDNCVAHLWQGPCPTFRTRACAHAAAACSRRPRRREDTPSGTTVNTSTTSTRDVNIKTISPHATSDVSPKSGNVLPQNVASPAESHVVFGAFHTDRRLYHHGCRLQTDLLGKRRCIR